MSGRTIHLVWQKPDGPEPAYYEATRTYLNGGDAVTYRCGITELVTDDTPRKHTWEVRAVYPSDVYGEILSQSCTLFRSFAITDIDIRDNGVIVTFATEPGRNYTLQKSIDATTWTDVATVLSTSDELSICGDASDPHATYRVLEQL